MAKSDQPTTIKKYANRRLYNTGTSTYVTLEDLAAMVKQGEDFLVYDAKTGDDIPRSVLAQIIFEQENKAGQNLLPTTFLRQLIRFYGDSMQMVVPKYLEQSIETLTREQEKFRKQLASTLSGTPFAPLEEQVRRNMELFQQMFKPFGSRGGAAEAAKAAEPPKQEDNIDDLRRQMKEMQERLDRMSKEQKKEEGFSYPLPWRESVTKSSTTRLTSPRPAASFLAAPPRDASQKPGQSAGPGCNCIPNRTAAARTLRPAPIRRPSRC